VARHPYWFIVAPVLVTLLFVYGNFHKNELNDMNKLYIPNDGPSLDERSAIVRWSSLSPVVQTLSRRPFSHFPQLDGKFTPSRSINDDGLVSVVVWAQDGGDVLRPELRRAVLRLNELLVDGVWLDDGAERLTYRNVCLRHRAFCHTNPQLYALDALYSAPGAYDRPTYPTAQLGARRFYVGATLGGVSVHPELRYITGAPPITRPAH